MVEEGPDATLPPPNDTSADEPSDAAQSQIQIPLGMSPERFLVLSKEPAIIKPSEKPGLSEIQRVVLEGLQAEFFAKERDVDLPDIDPFMMSDQEIQKRFPEVTNPRIFRRIVGDIFNYIDNKDAFRDRFGPDHGMPVRGPEDLKIDRLEAAQTRREHIGFLQFRNPEEYSIWLNEVKPTNQLAAHNNMSPVAMGLQVLSHIPLRAHDMETHQTLVQNGTRLAIMAQHENYDRLSDLGKLAVARELIDTSASGLKAFFKNRVTYTKHKTT